MKTSRLFIATLFFSLGCIGSNSALHAAGISAEDRARIERSVDANSVAATKVAMQIWNLAEAGFQEKQSSQALQDQLRAAGFTVRTGVAAMPTAFVASYRRGPSDRKIPIIAMLAEFDALPGQSQAVAVTRTPVATQLAGHACGHNLLGAGAVAASIAVKQWLVDTQGEGEIRVYGSPAEEGGSGKVYMVRAGLFDDVGVVLHWHPNDTNSAGQARSLANISGKFRFHGRAAHAARAPEQGRSALDAVEAMNFMVNAMREHVPQDVRIHYVITNGGASPNVVPDFAEVYYYVRNVDPRVVREVMERVQQAAAGAAMGTGTTYDFELTGAVFSLLPNDTLGRIMDTQLRAAPIAQLSDDAQRFTVQLAQSLSETNGAIDAHKAIASRQTIDPYTSGGISYVSTDVGDISWVVPTAGIRTATWPIGTPAHSWQATAASGTDIGILGMTVAAKTLALTAATFMSDATLIDKAHAELVERRGAQFKYQPLLGDRPPALDYRAK